MNLSSVVSSYCKWSYGRSSGLVNCCRKRSVHVEHLLFLAVFVIPAATAAPHTGGSLASLMPMPEKVEVKIGHLPLTRHLQIEWRGFEDELLKRAAKRMVANLNRRTGIDFVRDDSKGAEAIAITVNCVSADPNYLSLNADESYRLEVSTAGALLTANGPAGVLRGFATLVQLVQAGPEGFSLPAVSIADRPRFRWRGVMIDVSRHFMPAKLIEHELDVMEAVKLNVLHLHISDSDSFSIESKLYPGLQERGAIEGRYYTQNEVRDLVAYARDRGIRVVPEFDVPGHVKSWLAGYPELGSGAGPYKPESDYANADAALNPADEKVYQFLDGFFGEMAGLFSDQYFHIGGDEVIGKEWEKNAAIQEFMKKQNLQTKGQLQAYFTRRLNEIVQTHGKIMIGWDEVLDEGVPKSTAVEAWRSSRMTAESVKAGHATIVATPYYLDLLLPAGTHYKNDPMDTNSWGISEQEFSASNKMGGLLTDAFVLHGPIPLTPEQESLVLGGEAAMWTETITPEMLDAGLWPRLAAIAERFWSPKTVKDPDDMYQRLYVIDRLLGVLGTNQYANQKRIVDRLVPQDPGPLGVLTSSVEPIKYLSHWHSMRGGEQPDQNAIADAALPESLIAKQFCEHVHKLLAGNNWDLKAAQQLAVQLSLWRDNDAAFQRAAAEAGNLQVLLPLSADFSALSQVGIDSIEMLKHSHAPSREWIDTERALLAKHQKFADASSGYRQAFSAPQPPNEVLIAILPGIVELAQAAERLKN